MRPCVCVCVCVFCLKKNRSGPSLHLASQNSLSLPAGVNHNCSDCKGRKLSCSRHSPGSCAGVLIQSGLESGARVMFNKCISLACFPLDIMRNYRCIGRVNVPVAILHGEDDEVVPIQNGRNLHESCRFPVKPLWLPGVGHNDVPIHVSFAYLRDFIEQLGHEAKSSRQEASGLSQLGLLVATCSVAGCLRNAWNGQPGQQCCRTCHNSNGRRHGADCDRKAGHLQASLAGAANKKEKEEVAAAKKMAEEAAAVAGKKQEEEEEEARRKEGEEEAAAAKKKEEETAEGGGGVPEGGGRKQRR